MHATARYLAIALGCGSCFGLACGGSTRGDTSGGSGESGATGGGDTSDGGTEPGEAGGDGEGTDGGSESGGTGPSETGGSSGSPMGGSGPAATGGNQVAGGGSSGVGAAASGGTAGSSGGASPDGGVGAAATGGDGAAGDGFIWDGYDLTGVDIDESSSGTPVAADDPGNAYGRTGGGDDDPRGMMDCPEGGFGMGGMCVEFLACTYSCSTPEDCPSVDSGNTSPQCGGPFGEGNCALPCGNGLVCPDGMACVLIESGYFCAWPSLMLFPGCPGYCAEQDESCDSWTTGECCEGLVCAPWSQCEPGTCLRLSWPCNDDTAPCCEGTECVDGYCT